jgi:hypothetical protein
MLRGCPNSKSVCFLIGLSSPYVSVNAFDREGGLLPGIDIFYEGVQLHRHLISHCG